MTLQEGVLALWKGIRPALLAAVPTVGIYMPLYDIFRDRLEPSIGSTAAPLLASTSARAIAVFTVAPLEVLRTQRMSQRSTANVPRIVPPAGGCCIEVVQADVVRVPATSLWLKGLPATVRPPGLISLQSLPPVLLICPSCVLSHGCSEECTAVLLLGAIFAVALEHCTRPRICWIWEVCREEHCRLLFTACTCGRTGAMHAVCSEQVCRHILVWYMHGASNALAGDAQVVDTPVDQHRLRIQSPLRAEINPMPSLRPCSFPRCLPQ